jgi:hypothetical protein
LPDATDIRILFLRAKATAYRRRLDAMTPEQLVAYVASARVEQRWPPDPWLADHASKRLIRRTPRQYADLGQAIKRRPATQVYAAIHAAYSGGSSDGAETLIFIDPVHREMVWFDVESWWNVSVLDISVPVDQLIAQKGELCWKLADSQPPRKS